MVPRTRLGIQEGKSVWLRKARLFSAQCQVPMTKEAHTSRRATALVTAAKIPVKERVAKIDPPFSASNTFGSVTKIRLGPEAGSNPLAKYSRKMAIPARTAITVSRAAMLMQLLGMLISLSDSFRR